MRTILLPSDILGEPYRPCTVCKKQVYAMDISKQYTRDGWAHANCLRSPDDQS